MRGPPREEGAAATAVTVTGSLEIERFGRRLDISDTAAVQERQVAFVARRHSVRQPLAGVVVSLVFGEVRP